MELPCALESVLGALLQNHLINSWKVTSEGVNPCVVLRLKPLDDTQERVTTQAYRRKPQSQIERDRRRAAEHKQRLEHEQLPKSNASLLDPIGHDINAQSVGFGSIDASACSRQMNTDSANVDPYDSAIASGCVQPDTNTPHPARGVSLEQARAPSTVPAAPRTARGDEAEMDLSRGGEGGSDGDEDSEESEGSEGGDSASSTEGLFTNTDHDIATRLGTYRTLVKQKLDDTAVLHRSDLPTATQSVVRKLKDETRNERFTKITLDRRGPGVPRVLCRTDDLIFTCDTGTGEIDFFVYWDFDDSAHVSDLKRCVINWPGIDRGGTYSSWIRKLDDTLTMCAPLIREMV